MCIRSPEGIDESAELDLIRVARIGYRSVFSQRFFLSPVSRNGIVSTEIDKIVEDTVAAGNLRCVRLFRVSGGKNGFRFQ